VEPTSFTHALADYVFFFQAMPTGPLKTTVTAKWVVHKDAAEGVDYDLHHLTEVWEKTNAQDRWLAENAQKGVCSIGFRPGPYSKDNETFVAKFIDWYLETAKDYLSAQRGSMGASALVRA
ncbi:MAG: SRPBCC family protein, partial [Terriglobales bacterium]